MERFRRHEGRPRNSGTRQRSIEVCHTGTHGRLLPMLGATFAAATTRAKERRLTARAANVSVRGQASPVARAGFEPAAIAL